MPPVIHLANSLPWRVDNDTTLPLLSPSFHLGPSMPFLRGSLGFERFNVTGFDSDQFGQEHIEILTQHTAGKIQTSSLENVHVGFLGGDHLFDQDFDLGKNLINNALHCSVRIDTNQIPTAIRSAWLQMELSGLKKDNEGEKLSKSQRKEAKEAVEQRCEVEAASGKYRKMQTFPMLWDFDQELLYFGGSVGTASGHCMDLLERTFGIELRRVGAGAMAEQWAIEEDRFGELDDLVPVSFVSNGSQADHAWSNEHSQAPDFLGNEFLLWLWWNWETNSNVVTLSDGSEVSGMFARSLSLDCPDGEHGKESISSESPVALPEAALAIRMGKLPRKAGLTLVRNGEKYDFTLQAETFSLGSARIAPADESSDNSRDVNDRIESVRQLCETVDLLYAAFCEKRIGQKWKSELAKMSQWLALETPMKRQRAA